MVSVRYLSGTVYPLGEICSMIILELTELTRLDSRSNKYLSLGVLGLIRILGVPEDTLIDSRVFSVSSRISLHFNNPGICLLERRSLKLDFATNRKIFSSSVGGTNKKVAFWHLNLHLFHVGYVPIGVGQEPLSSLHC
jgi:hypothetical protein